MEIRKTGYIPWQGTLRESGWRGWPIFKHGVATVFQRKKAKLLFAFAEATVPKVTVIVAFAPRTLGIPVVSEIVVPLL